MESEELQPKPRRRSKKALVVGISALIIITAAAAGFLIWKAQQPHSLLPKEVESQSVSYTPYFFYDTVPAGYKLSKFDIDEQAGVTLFSLTKAGSPSIVLTEQRLSSSINTDDILKGEESEKVSDAAAPAVLNSVEGRFVGIMLDRSNRTMVLINSPGTADKEDIKNLLRGLKPIK